MCNFNFLIDFVQVRILLLGRLTITANAAIQPRGERVGCNR